MILLLVVVACNNGIPKPEEPIKDLTKEEQPVAPASTKQLSPEMQKVRDLLVGDWEEDTTAFKQRYNMPPPPAQNCKVRWQNDGRVYIPGVLLTQENWDRWELANDTTIHVVKRQTGDVRVFVIHDISADSMTYKMLRDDNQHRIFKLAKINK